MNTDNADIQLDIFHKDFSDCLNGCAPNLCEPWIADEKRLEVNVRKKIGQILFYNRILTSRVKSINLFIYLFFASVDRNIMKKYK